MKHSIHIDFDPHINGYLITMPESISLSAIEEWKVRFNQELKSVSHHQAIIMLIDTNQHQFESVQCLKSLRDFFSTSPVIQSNGVKVAFVQPENFMQPHVKSASEAYFTDYKKAYQ